jgi:uncharacterized protein YlxW (UPF0749 family)
MTLLIEVMESPLDPSYAEAAERRRNQPIPGPARRLTRRTIAAIVAVVLGFGVATAAHQLRVPATSAREARTLLERQISERRAHIDDVTASIDTTQSEISAIQETVLAGTDPALLRQIETDTLRNGSAAVTGQGLVISITNGGGGGLAETTTDQMVRDADIRAIVRALWASGAEAIAVDDQRLTMTSAIRNAGQAIQVDLVSLSGPTYVIWAIGDSEAMQAAWARTAAPDYLQFLRNELGITSSVTPQSKISLPAAGAQVLQYAHAPE